jgi:hypothetical protein
MMIRKMLVEMYDEAVMAAKELRMLKHCMTD